MLFPVSEGDASAQASSCFQVLAVLQTASRRVVNGSMPVWTDHRLMSNDTPEWLHHHVAHILLQWLRDHSACLKFTRYDAIN